MYTSNKILEIEDIDSRIDLLRSRLQFAIRRGGDLPLCKNPKVLALSRTLDILINQVQMKCKK